MIVSQGEGYDAYAWIIAEKQHVTDMSNVLKAMKQQLTPKAPKFANGSLRVNKLGQLAGQQQACRYRKIPSDCKPFLVCTLQLHRSHATHANIPLFRTSLQLAGEETPLDRVVSYTTRKACSFRIAYCGFTLA